MQAPILYMIYIQVFIRIQYDILQGTRFLESNKTFVKCYATESVMSNSTCTYILILVTGAIQYTTANVSHDGHDMFNWCLRVCLCCGEWWWSESVYYIKPHCGLVTFGHMQVRWKTNVSIANVYLYQTNSYMVVFITNISFCGKNDHIICFLTDGRNKS